MSKSVDLKPKVSTLPRIFRFFTPRDFPQASAEHDIRLGKMWMSFPNGVLNAEQQMSWRDSIPEPFEPQPRTIIGILITCLPNEAIVRDRKTNSDVCIPRELLNGEKIGDVVKVVVPVTKAFPGYAALMRTS